MSTIAELTTLPTADDTTLYVAEHGATTGKITVAAMKTLLAPASGTYVTPTALGNASLPASVTTLAAAAR
jgi:hypothetical protein